MEIQLSKKWDPDLVIRAATAVMVPGSSVMQLGAGNKPVRHGISLDEAAREGVAILVHLLDNIAAWDLDSHEEVEKARAYFRYLEAQGFLPTLWPSGQPGHAHLIVRCADHEQRVRVTRAFKVRKSKRSLRPPLSPHRWGLAVGVLDLPLDVALRRLEEPTPNGGVDDVASLITTAPAPVLSYLGVPSMTSARVLDQAVEAVANAVKGHRNNTLLSRSRLVFGYVATGELDEVESRRRLFEAALRSDLDEGEADRAIEHGELSGLEAPLRSPTMDVIALLWREVEEAQWPGKQGPTAAKVLTALLLKAEKALRNPFGASLRDLALLAGVTPGATSSGLEYLQKAGIVRPDEAQPSRVDNSPVGKTSKRPPASRWLLVAPEDGSDTVESHPPRFRKSNVCRSFQDPSDPLHLGLGHDAWRQGALGSAWLVAIRLRAYGPMRAAEIVESLGQSAPSVRRNLKALGDVGMAERNSDGSWQLYAGPGLDEVASRLGTAGVGERQRALYARERDAWLTDSEWISKHVVVLPEPGFGGGGGRAPIQPPQIADPD